MSSERNQIALMRVGCKVLFLVAVAGTIWIGGINMFNHDPHHDNWGRETTLAPEPIRVILFNSELQWAGVAWGAFDLLIMLLIAWAWPYWFILKYRANEREKKLDEFNSYFRQSRY